MLVHELAARSRLSVHTIRHYVRIGLLKPGRRANGYAAFDEDAVVVAEIIQIAKAVGFSLQEIKRDLQPFRSGQMTFADVRAALIKKEEELLQRIEELSEMRKRLRTMIANCPLQNVIGRGDFGQANRLEGGTRRPKRRIR